MNKYFEYMDPIRKHDLCWAIEILDPGVFADDLSVKAYNALFQMLRRLGSLAYLYRSNDKLPERYEIEDVANTNDDEMWSPEDAVNVLRNFHKNNNELNAKLANEAFNVILEFVNKLWIVAEKGEEQP